MKLRVRSMETKETVKIETPNPCSVEHLKTLISNRIEVPEGSSLHLSLNRKDEVEVDPSSSSSPCQTNIDSLGIISGDLVFYSFSPFASHHSRVQPVAEGTVIFENKGKDVDVLNVRETGDEDEGTFNRDSGGAKDLHPHLSELHADQMDLVTEQELVPTGSSSAFSVPGFLKRVMEEEMGVVSHDYELLVIAVHAVFLESGFVVCGPDGNTLRLPEGWTSPAIPLISLSYTISGLESTTIAPVTVKFSYLGRFANVYGSLGGCCSICRASFDVSRFGPSFRSSLGEMNEEDEGRVFELWKVVKDKLSLPLLIYASERYGLPLPPCFTLLPVDVKIKILDLLPGVDLARTGCVNIEMRYLSSNDEIWAKKFIEEFNIYEGKGLFGKRWKDKFVICWEKRKRLEENANKILHNRTPADMPRSFWRGPVPFAPPLFNMIGGDYDRLPAIGGARNGSGLNIPRLLHNRNFSPRCNFDTFGG